MISVKQGANRLKGPQDAKISGKQMNLQQRMKMKTTQSLQASWSLCDSTTLSIRIWTDFSIFPNLHTMLSFGPLKPTSWPYTGTPYKPGLPVLCPLPLISPAQITKSSSHAIFTSSLLGSRTYCL